MTSFAKDVRIERTVGRFLVVAVFAMQASTAAKAGANGHANEVEAVAIINAPQIAYRMDGLIAEPAGEQSSGSNQLPFGVHSAGVVAPFIETVGDRIKVEDAGQLLEREFELPARVAAGAQVIASTDSSTTDVLRIRYQSMLRYVHPWEYLGVTFEGAWITPFGGETDFSRRVYIEVADNLGEWDFDARIGTDGSTVVGAASIHNHDWSKRFFFDRDIVETFDGVDLGIYATLIGAEFRTYLDSKNTLNYGFGLTEYVGKNMTFYVESGFTHQFDRKLGLNAQLQMRYEHSTFPDEFDYYAPENRVEIMPILALTRYSSNWSYNIEGGYGVQRATETDWQDLRYAQFWFQSPDIDSGIKVEGSITYSNTSLQAGPNFDYVGGNLGLFAVF